MDEAEGIRAEPVTPRRRRRPGTAWGGAWAVRLLTAGFVLAVIFRLTPWFDLALSDLFYRPGQGFWLADSFYARFWQRGMPLARDALLIGFAVWLGLWIRRQRPPRGIPVKAMMILALSLALGPGLLVNVIFKDNWGRPRPVQIENFGGTATYVAPFVPSRACERNCSFPAGHPAFFFGFFALALAFRRRRTRLAAISAVTCVGGLAGLGRMMQGKHFLSDVLYSGLLCYLVAWILFAALYEWRVLARWRVRERLYTLSQWLGRLRRGEIQLPTFIRPDASLLATESSGTLGLIALFVTIAFTKGVLDVPLAQWLHTVQDSAVVGFFRWLAPFGKSWIWLLGFGVALLFFAAMADRAEDGKRRRVWRRQARTAGFLFCCILAASTLASLLKPLFGRANPAQLFADGTSGLYPFRFDTGFWSLPSADAATIVAWAAAVIFLWPRLTFPAVVFAILVSLSRVVLTAHYLTDVLLGALVAIPACLIVRLIFRDFGADIFPPAPDSPANKDR